MIVNYFYALLTIAKLLFFRLRCSNFVPLFFQRQISCHFHAFDIVLPQNRAAEQPFWFGNDGQAQILLAVGGEIAAHTATVAHGTQHSGGVFRLSLQQ